MTAKLVLWMYAPDQPMWSAPPETLDTFRDELEPEWRIVEVREPVQAMGDGAAAAPDALVDALRDADAYCGFGFPPEALREARQLRWVHTAAAGVAGILYPEMLDSEVVLTNAAGVYAEPMGEHALAMILHFARALDEAVAAQARGTWARGTMAGPGHRIRELAGRLVGVVGYGGAGRAVGRRAEALGMRVWGIRRTAPVPDDEIPGEVERLLGPDGLGELLAAADYVVLTLPETDETRGMIGERELARMGPGSVLVNVSRGEVVDEEALVRALRDGEIRGAGMDVFHEEPLPPSSPFWALENVLVTPHTSGVSPRVWERQTELVLENARRFLDGRPMLNEVDKERGY